MVEVDLELLDSSIPFASASCLKSWDCARQKLCTSLFPARLARMAWHLAQSCDASLPERPCVCGALVSRTTNSQHSPSRNVPGNKHLSHSPSRNAPGNKHVSLGNKHVSLASEAKAPVLEEFPVTVASPKPGENNATLMFPLL